MGIEEIKTIVVDWVKEKGGVFLLPWVFGMWVVWQTKGKPVFGLELSDADRGLLMVAITLICLVSHSCFYYFTSKRAFYEPKNISPELKKTIVSLRNLCGHLRAYRVAEALPLDVNEASKVLYMSHGHLEGITQDNAPQVSYNRLSNALAVFLTAHGMPNATDAHERARIETQLHRCAEDFILKTNKIV